MTHARITQARMFDWIRACIDTDAPLPTDADIVDQFGLPSVESSRSLLADLADAGKITIRGMGADRVITLGPKERPAMVPARPTPAIQKSLAEEISAEADASSSRRVAAARSGTTIRPGDKAKATPGSKRRLTLDQTAERVKDILARGSAAKTPDSPLAQYPRAEAAKGRSQRIPPPIRVEAAPQPVAVEPPAHTRSAPGSSEARNHQLSFTITADMRDALDARAARSGQTRSWEAFSLLTEALTVRETAPAPIGKPRVRADVVKAWQADGRPFGEFVSALIDIGLEEYRRFWRGSEVAE